MLSTFPSLFSYSLIAPLLIRLVLGLTVIHFGYTLYKKSGKIKAGPIVEWTVGLLFIIGLFTQIVAGLTAIVLLILIIKKISRKAFLTDGVNYYLILLVLSICLLVLGAGRLAFDLPI